MDTPLTFDELAVLMKDRAGITADPREMESRPAMTFADFGLDSLGLLGIVGELENRRSTPIAAGAELCKTPHEFLEHVNASLTAGA